MVCEFDSDPDNCSTPCDLAPASCGHGWNSGGQLLIRCLVFISSFTLQAVLYSVSDTCVMHFEKIIVRALVIMDFRNKK